jgi:hypothetical protein
MLGERNMLFKVTFHLNVFRMQLIASLAQHNTTLRLSMVYRVAVLINSQTQKDIAFGT